MALYLSWFSFASVWPDLNYSLKHASNLRRPDMVGFGLEALKFWDKHGLKAAMDFAKASRSTLYNWRKALADSRKLDKRYGRASLKALDPKSTRPQHCRTTTWSPLVVSFIRTAVTNHPELGKQKIRCMLKRHLERPGQSLLLVSESTVGRILTKLRQAGKLPGKERLSYYARTGKLRTHKKRHTKKLRRKDLGMRINRPGDLVQIDGIEGYWLGKHYYIVNAIDYVFGKVVSRAMSSKSSAKTADFLSSLSALMGFPIKAIQTDNGSEYAARFHDMATRLGIKHCFNYVKKPIYNGKVERFNRTLQDALFYATDLLDYLATDLTKAQAQIDSYLEFYNNDRPHISLDFKTPNEILLQYQVA